MSDWIEWDGGECPVPSDCQVEVVVRCGDLIPREAGSFNWLHVDNFNYSAPGSKRQIVKFRITDDRYTVFRAPDGNLVSVPKREPDAEEPTALANSGAAERKHAHYFKDVSELDEVDVYRVCDLFEIDDHSGAIHHAVKKLLCSGKRGVKDKRKDIQEAVDTLNRWLEIHS